MKSNSDHPAATGPGRRGVQPFDDWLKKQLHEMYDFVALEPLPRDLARLIGKVAGPDAQDDATEPASQ